jgi:hypothetical protein
MALTIGLMASMRSRKAVITAAQDKSRRAISLARSVAGSSVGSVKAQMFH